VTRVIASPALRCRRLAEGLAARDQVELSFEPRLWELDMGRWDGLHWDQIPRAESEAWLADPWHRAAPGGETYAALHARVGEVLATVAADTALVCHAGPIRAARMIFAGLSFAEALGEVVPFAQPVRIRREGA
jgi:alpha-ribazole phosphatase